ncbi:MAG: GNAT family N-acetyltransferase [Nocardioidaceae bacterium]
MTPEDAAGAAATTAGVRLRELTEIEEFRAVVKLLADVWGRTDNPPVNAELLRAFAKTGNYVAGAHDGPRLVGTCIGFYSGPSTQVLHSHIAGVAPKMAGRGVGFALKLHQRAWALQRGVEVIEWTFDPLVARNAYFNLVKLTARAAEYLTNFYGPMLDVINGDDDTDRLLVRWELASPDVIAASAGSPRRRPVPQAGSVRVGVPDDIEAMRLVDPDKAREWRMRVREQLAPLIAAGGRIVDFDPVAGYLVEPEATDPTEEKVP